MKEQCPLWESSKTLGRDKGFILHGECPINAYCKEPQCIFISDFEAEMKEKDRQALEKLRLEIINEG